MSATLFNFYINPILAMVHRLGATCLGYMDDLAVIVPKHLEVQSIVNEVTRVADALRMSFNIKKCGIMNQDKPTSLKAENVQTAKENPGQAPIHTQHRMQSGPSRPSPGPTIAIAVPEPNNRR